MLFQVDVRPTVKEDLSKKTKEVKPTEIMSEIGKLWKALDEEKKKVLRVFFHPYRSYGIFLSKTNKEYEQKATKDKERYEQEMKEYNQRKKDATTTEQKKH